MWQQKCDVHDEHNLSNVLWSRHSLLLAQKYNLLMEVNIRSANECDFHELHNLMQTAFAERKNSGVEVPTVSALSQKYLQSPFASRLALVHSSKKLVGMNGLLPILINTSGVEEIAWMSCDTATHPEARGQGLFRKCISALEESLEVNTLIFGFPNNNSLPGFYKFGWKKILEIELAASIIGLKRDSRLSIGEFKPSLGNQSTKSGIVKNNEYLGWRYNATRDTYKMATYENSKVIYKVMNFSGIKTLVVLEDENSFSAKQIRSIANKERCPAVLVSKTQSPGKGFIKIPNKLNSRPILLLGKRVNNFEWKPEDESWNPSLGDFDAI